VEERSPSPLADHLIKVLLTLLLAWSFLLRAWVATPELTARRFHDEVYGRENVRALLAGQLRPTNTFYPSLSYLPQAALLAVSEGLHRVTGRDVFRVFSGQQDFTALGYLLSRLLQAVFGTLSLYLTFRIGKRLFSAPVGLAGALLLSVVEWHIRQSAIFKPDILLVLTSLLAFLWSLDAAERPSWRRYLLAGVGIGLALASKYNAAPIAIPLFVATLPPGPGRDRRRWAWLLLAAAVAAAVFLLLNPFFVLDPDFYRKDFGRTLRDYAKKAHARAGSHWDLPVHALRTLMSESFHGPVVGALGILGAAGLAIVITRRPEARIGRVMALSFVVGYVLLYSVATTHASPHNWLVLTPFTSLFAAWATARTWGFLSARWPVLARPQIAVAAAAPAVLLLVAGAQAMAYSHVVPMTWDAAVDHVNGSLRPLSGRLVYYEQGEKRLVFRYGYDKAMAVGKARLAQLPSQELDRADVELFPEDRLSGPDGDFYQRRIATVAPQEVVRIDPALFRLRGPSLVLLIHPWQRAGEPVFLTLSHPGGAPRRLVGALPSLAPREVGSLELLLPTMWKGQSIRSLLLGSKPLELASFGTTTETVVTARFDAVEAQEPLLLRLRHPITPGGEEIRVRLHRWRR
jgi:dolichyl-phosphate-mannose-protein mannosyltransferase